MFPTGFLGSRAQHDLGCHPCEEWGPRQDRARKGPRCRGAAPLLQGAQRTAPCSGVPWEQAGPTLTIQGLLPHGPRCGFRQGLHSVHRRTLSRPAPPSAGLQGPPRRTLGPRPQGSKPRRTQTRRTSAQSVTSTVGPGAAERERPLPPSVPHTCPPSRGRGSRGGAGKLPRWQEERRVSQ